MRILHVINSVGGSGGTENALAAVAPALIARGLELGVAFFDSKPGLQDALAGSGVSLHHLATPDGHLSRVRALRALVRTLGPSIIYTSLFESDVAGRTVAALERVPVVSALVNVSYGPEQLRTLSVPKWKVRAVQLVDIATARTVSRFHAVSRYVADTMAGRLAVPRNRIEVIPRGRELSSLGRVTETRRRRVRAGLGLGDEPLIVAAARHEPQKGLDVLIRAMADLRRTRLPAAQLIVAGRTGNSTALLGQLIDEHGLRDSVKTLGVRSDVADLLAAADVVAIPSRWEGIPNVMIEAMALQVPVVASDVPAVREVMGAEFWARLVPPDSPGDLARVLADALEADDAGVRGHAALARFTAEYSTEGVADRMVALFESVVRSPRRGLAPGHPR
jgi:glycosyltransferase involved in cell wall biosynthesis